MWATGGKDLSYAGKNRSSIVYLESEKLHAIWHRRLGFSRIGKGSQIPLRYVTRREKTVSSLQKSVRAVRKQLLGSRSLLRLSMIYKERLAGDN